MSLWEKFGANSQNGNSIRNIRKIRTIHSGGNSADIADIADVTLTLNAEGSKTSSADTADIADAYPNLNNVLKVKAVACVISSGMLLSARDCFWDFRTWCRLYPDGCFTCPEYMDDQPLFCRKHNMLSHGKPVVGEDEGWGRI